MTISKENPLLATDVYKMGHMEQYAPGCNKVYSYLTARSDKTFDKTMFFGLQYYLKEYFSIKLTPEMGEEFLKYRKMILGANSEEVESKIRALCKLGYFPLEIKAVEEGTVMPVKNVLMTVTNTHPDFYWVVGFTESLILKLWYSITVASCCHKYRVLVDKYYSETVSEDLMFLKDFTVHDFGYRGDASEEGSAISGAAHLISFLGSDTVPALPFTIKYYHADENKPIMLSVPASEHSVMCSFGREDELGAFKNMLKLYKSGIVSIVSDTFDVYKVLTEFAEILKPEILARDGKVVFRPDSGNPEYIICGDPNAPEGSNEWKGAIRLLDEKFGSSINDKGYKVLNPKVGLIYGDGMYWERYERTLERMKQMGYASSNLVIGVGGILRNHSRDTLGFAIKATYVEVNGEKREIEKDPVTDRKKKSHKGLLSLIIDESGNYSTMDQCSLEEEQAGLLQVVFKDGKLLKEYTLDEIRERVRKQ
ncbi:MAG: nicotinate phosphoribosyltransferase [Candidatus Sericytochromatia bacterium]